MAQTFAEIMMALGLVMGGHEMGHSNEADRLGVPISFDDNIVWKANTTNQKKLSRIANSGFEMQDKLPKATKGSSIDKPAKIISALNKLGYVIKPSGMTSGAVGDVRMIEKHKGKKARKVAQGALTISALDDILTAFGKKKSDKGFKFMQSPDGTPMLGFGGSF